MEEEKQVGGASRRPLLDDMVIWGHTGFTPASPPGGESFQLVWHPGLGHPQQGMVGGWEWGHVCYLHHTLQA